MSTCISTKIPTVDKGCGKAVDIVDKGCANRDVPPFFPVEAVDKPVDNVDNSELFKPKGCYNYHIYVNQNSVEFRQQRENQTFRTPPQYS